MKKIVAIVFEWTTSDDSKELSIRPKMGRFSGKFPENPKIDEFTKLMLTIKPNIRRAKLNWAGIRDEYKLENLGFPRE